MASETLSFNIVGHDQGASAAFRKVGDTAELAARGARTAAVALERQRKAADASVGATLALAKADKLLADAEHGLNDEALRTEFLLKKQAETARKSASGGGAGGAGGAASRLAGGAGPGILGISGRLASLVAGGGALAAAIPALTAIGAAVGTIGAGIALVFGKGGPLAKQGKQLVQTLRDTFAKAVTPLIAPLRQAFTQFLGFLKQIGPQLKGVFAAVAPVIGPVLHGLEAAVKGILPGFVALLKAAGPAVKVLSSVIGTIGKNLGAVFKAFAPVVAASSVVLKALAGVITTLLPIVGKVVAILAKNFAPVIKVVTTAVKVLAPVLQVIGRVVAAFAVAAFKDLAGVLGAVVTLIQGIAPSLKVLAGVIGSVFNTLENTGVFPILASALEGIAKPLAGLINALVKGLAPIIPPIVKLASSLAGTIVKVLVTALKVVIPILTTLIKDILKPIIPLIKALAPLIALVAKGLGVVLVAAIKLVSPLLNVIVKVLGWITSGLTVVIKWVVGLARNWRQAWADIKQWAKDAWDFLTHGWGQWLVPGLTVIRKTIEFVRDHWKAAWGVIKSAASAAWNWIHDHVVAPFIAAYHALKNIVGFFGRVGGFLSGGGGASTSARTAQQYALGQLPRYGWSVDQMPPLAALWQRESGWSNTARNPTSGAYGIPQALPPSKMGAAANPPTSSYIAQINWGLSYIKNRPGYGSPAAAWAHEMAYGWYDKGGWLRPGLTLAYNGTGRPEPVGAMAGQGIPVLRIEGAGDDLTRAIVLALRKHVRVNGRGDVQIALGTR